MIIQASGLIPIAHDSGGPKTDIVVDYNGSPTGFRARTEEEYASHLFHIFGGHLSDKDQDEMRRNARNAVQARFSVDKFSSDFVDNLLIALKKPI